MSNNQDEAKVSSGTSTSESLPEGNIISSGDVSDNNKVDADEIEQSHDKMEDNSSSADSSVNGNKLKHDSGDEDEDEDDDDDDDDPLKDYKHKGASLKPIQVKGQSKPRP